ncbi:MAG: ADP-glyceromanno-heptose 6-epimerase [Candidatus Competibacteraceae bacterium]|nr:ADP-glyceromanno-heptose 6-epimerase [Candidatus Competibacteraceae bacterium]
MIVVTGAAGFIGSYLSGCLNRAGYKNLVLVDDFGIEKKASNYENINCNLYIHRDAFIEWFSLQAEQVEAVFHLGARTDTSEQNEDIFNQLNLNYSKLVWHICSQYDIPLFYASSAATYGNGKQGYSDDESLLSMLEPLNPYARSKHRFDLWAISQQSSPSHWYGFKFFNVYGPNEYHKGRMASVVYHAFKQIEDRGSMSLFKSHREGWQDGEQRRDFIYVQDIASILLYFFQHRPANGIYNTGTGVARTFLDLAHAVFSAMQINPVIDFIDMPADIRLSYQYYTEAEVNKLRLAGYQEPFYTLEEGIKTYVSTYLQPHRWF